MKGLRGMYMKKRKACEVRRYEVAEADLPLSCPMKKMELWNAHPKVYLPIEKTGHAVCPYCSAEYFLKVQREEPVK